MAISLFTMRWTLVKRHSGDKIVPQSDLHVGIPRDITLSWVEKMLCHDWNVHTLLQCGKLKNLKLETEKMNLNMLVVSEVRWPDNRDFWSVDYQIHTGYIEYSIEYTTDWTNHSSKIEYQTKWDNAGTDIHINIEPPRWWNWENITGVEILMAF